MDIGVHLPQLGRGATRSALKEFCAEAERLGDRLFRIENGAVVTEEITSKKPEGRRPRLP